MKKILAIMLVLCMMTACTPNEPVVNENVDNPEIVTPVEDKFNLIRKSNEDINYNDYELLGHYITDIDGIDEEVDISLYTSAQRDKMGNIMWDDSQNWFLTAKISDGIYMLYNERINGRAYMKVMKSYNDNSEETLINLHIYANTHNEIREYSFNGENFEERIRYTTDGISKQGISELYTSIPDYQ